MLVSNGFLQWNCHAMKWSDKIWTSREVIWLNDMPKGTALLLHECMSFLNASMDISRRVAPEASAVALQTEINKRKQGSAASRISRARSFFVFVMPAASSKPVESTPPAIVVVFC
jgi:hypothetical protein